MASDYQPLPGGAPAAPRELRRQYSETRLVSGNCCGRFTCFMMQYFGLMALAVALIQFDLVEIGGIVLALGPSWAIVRYYSTRYGAHVLPGQAGVVFLECFLLLPLVMVLEQALSSATPDHSQLVRIAFMAFVMAAGSEELYKYLLTRRFLWKEHVADPRALIFLAIVAANAFAAIENVLYVLFRSGAMGSLGPSFLPPTALEALADYITGPAPACAMTPPVDPADLACYSDWVRERQGALMMAVGVPRALLAIPLHSSTGAVIGALLAKRRFLGRRTNIIYILFMPIFTHGLYDFAAMGGLPHLFEAVGVEVPEEAMGPLMFGTLVFSYCLALALAKRATGQLAAVPHVSLKEALALQQGVAPSAVKVPLPDTILHELLPCCCNCCWPRNPTVRHTAVRQEPLLPPYAGPVAGVKAQTDLEAQRQPEKSS